MSFQDFHIHITSYLTTNIGRFQSLNTKMDNLGHYFSIIKSKNSLFTSLKKNTTNKTNLKSIILTTYTINGQIETSKIST